MNFEKEKLFVVVLLVSSINHNFIYYRERDREGEREANHMQLCLCIYRKSHAMSMYIHLRQLISFT